MAVRRIIQSGVMLFVWRGDLVFFFVFFFLFFLFFFFFFEKIVDYDVIKAITEQTNRKRIESDIYMGHRQTA